MPTFTVHAPPPKTGESAANPERFVFVRDGFYFWAFVLAPLWLLLHRLWLVLLGYIVLNGLLVTGLYLIGAPGATKLFVGMVVALLVGFEAATLWRWTLTRRGWQAHGFSVGHDVESAEQRFFAAWATRKADASPSQTPPEKFAPPYWRGPPAPSDVIGLFPEPGGKP
jgi:hypothetical protein